MQRAYRFLKLYLCSKWRASRAFQTSPLTRCGYSNCNTTLSEAWGPVIRTLAPRRERGVKDWNLTYGESGAILLASGISAPLGSLFYGWLADKIGRRKVMIITIDARPHDR
jgi:MFS family permease